MYLCKYEHNAKIRMVFMSKLKEILTKAKEIKAKIKI